METALKIVPEADEVSQEVMDINGQAKALKMIDSESYLKAGALWQAIKALRKKVDDTFSPIIAAAFQAHKMAVAKKKEIDVPLEEAERRVKSAMSGYEAELERIRLSEQKRLEEEARKAEEERRLLEAIEAEQNGDKEVAEAILQEEVYTPPVVLPKETPKVQGLSFRTIWKFKITNASKVPDQYKIVDEVKVGQVVRALKRQTNIPGIEVYEERV